ncbi:MAG: hypothetical protein HRT74_08885 [Flavobacteriales bacterium]|nr:hypothetical protein [Flavobacteriales bacterium]
MMAEVLSRPKVKDSTFADYKDGIVKSLGAWGGDFVMVTTKDESSLNYFNEKGFNIILPWKEMVHAETIEATTQL